MDRNGPLAASLERATIDLTNVSVVLQCVMMHRPNAEEILSCVNEISHFKYVTAKYFICSHGRTKHI